MAKRLKTGKAPRGCPAEAGLQGFTKPQAGTCPLAKPWVSPSGFQGKGEKEYIERSKAGVEKSVWEMGREGMKKRGLNDEKRDVCEETETGDG